MKKPRISLKVALLLVAVLCVWLGKISIEANRQKEAVAWIRRNGGFVTHDRVIDSNGAWRVEESAQYPGWTISLLGEDYFRTVTTVELLDSPVEDVSLLAQLPSLIEIKWSGRNIKDISALAALDKVESMVLVGTQVSDVSPLGEMRHLRHLRADSNLIRDVKPLFKLSNLKMLSLTANPIDNADTDQLRDALPGCEIHVTKRNSPADAMGSFLKNAFQPRPS